MDSLREDILALADDYCQTCDVVLKIPKTEDDLVHYIWKGLHDIRVTDLGASKRKIKEVLRGEGMMLPESHED